MTADTIKKMNAALSALNAQMSADNATKAEYLDQFRTREDVQSFAREGTGTNDESPEDELEKEEEWVDEAWKAVEEYIEARDAE